MSTVVGLFDDPQHMQQALDALNKANLGDDIKEVIESSEELSNDAAVAPTAIGVGSTYGQGVAVPTFVSYSDMGEEGEFFKTAVEKGGRLVILDTDDNEQAVSIFKRFHASKVYDSGAD